MQIADNEKKIPFKVTLELVKKKNVDRESIDVARRDVLLCLRVMLRVLIFYEFEHAGG